VTADMTFSEAISWTCAAAVAAIGARAIAPAQQRRFVRINNVISFRSWVDGMAQVPQQCSRTFSRHLTSKDSVLKCL
jgi:hypothetical protein